MKVAAAHAIAKLAREYVPDEVVAAMGGERQKYGREYIIPSTFDPRLITKIPPISGNKYSFAGSILKFVVT